MAGLTHNLTYKLPFIWYMRAQTHFQLHRYMLLWFWTVWEWKFEIVFHFISSSDTWCFHKKINWISCHFNIVRLLFTRKLGIFGFNLSNALRNSVLEPFLFTFWLLLCFCLFFSFFFFEIYEMVFWALN